MKNLALSVLFYILASQLSAQTVSGLYSGMLRNDSAKQIQKYELALSEYRDKITGYAYATFIKNDTFYYSIRRVRAVREGNQLVVEDEDMVANNFPVKPDKGVHRISYIPLQQLKPGDTLTTFSGSWKTTQTKKFYSVPGTMAMRRDDDSLHSALVAHLRELNLMPPENKAVAQREDRKQPEQAVAKTNPTATRTEKVSPTLVKTPTPAKQPPVAASKPSPQHGDLKKLNPAATKPASAPAAPVALLAYTERKKPAPQIFDVVSDSLTLSFYDNGVVDGDVISVYLNGEPIIANAKLLEAATKKIIHLPATVDSVELLLVAETLGSIPPNTGLLVVQDGSARYEVRFSADLQTNASIVFRKRN